MYRIVLKSIWRELGWRRYCLLLVMGKHYSFFFFSFSPGGQSTSIEEENVIHIINEALIYLSNYHPSLVYPPHSWQLLGAGEHHHVTFTKIPQFILLNETICHELNSATLSQPDRTTWVAFYDQWTKVHIASFVYPYWLGKQLSFVDTSNAP